MSYYKKSNNVNEKQDTSLIQSTKGKWENVRMITLRYSVWVGSISVSLRRTGQHSASAIYEITKLNLLIIICRRIKPCKWKLCYVAVD